MIIDYSSYDLSPTVTLFNPNLHAKYPFDVPYKVLKKKQGKGSLLSLCLANKENIGSGKLDWSKIA